MIEKQIKVGPHVIDVEEHVNKRTRTPLPAKQTLCHRKPATHIHEVYRCPHGERTWCVGDIKVQWGEVQAFFFERFGCACTME